MAATMIYDGQTYNMRDEDVETFKQTVTETAVHGAGWLKAATDTGQTVAVFISAGVNVAILTE